MTTGPARVGVLGGERRSGRRGGRLPLEVYLRRRRWLRAAGVAIGVALLLGAWFMGDREADLLAGLERVELEVVEVVDAATLRVLGRNRSKGAAVTVRLAGVDGDGPWASACREVLGEQVKGGPVRVTWQERVRRDGGRAYVYLSDGRLVNAWLIEQGHAPAVGEGEAGGAGETHPLGAWFNRLEGRAQQRERGMWGR